MIFITVGTQKFQFNRLLSEIDILIKEKLITNNIYAQIGYSTYVPTNFSYSKLIDADKMDDLIRNSDLVITHGGTSSIFHALKYKKKIIVVPRLAKFNEHVDDHQLEICRVLESQNYIRVVYNIEDLKTEILTINEKILDVYNNSSNSLINEIKRYIGI